MENFDQELLGNIAECTSKHSREGKMIAPTSQVESWQIQGKFRKVTTDANFHVGTALLARCMCGCVSLVFSLKNHVRHPQTEGFKTQSVYVGDVFHCCPFFFRFSFFPFCPFFSVLSSSTSPFSLLVSIREMLTFVNALSFMKRHTIVCVHRPNLRSRNGHCSSVKGQVHFLRLQGCIRVAITCL